jgi:hypothetical protein
MVYCSVVLNNVQLWYSLSHNNIGNTGTVHTKYWDKEESLEEEVFWKNIVAILSIWAAIKCPPKYANSLD